MAPPFETVLFTVADDNVATITLNRPEVLGLAAVQAPGQPGCAARGLPVLSHQPLPFHITYRTTNFPPEIPDMSMRKVRQVGGCTSRRAAGGRGGAGGPGNGQPAAIPGLMPPSGPSLHAIHPGTPDAASQTQTPAIQLKRICGTTGGVPVTVPALKFLALH
jgi:hypothetical protein